MSSKLPPWVPYVVPFAVYLILTGIEVHFPAIYPQFYMVKIVISTIVALLLRPERTARRPLPWGWIAVAVVAGIALNWVWFAVDRVTPHWQWLGTRPAYDPLTAIRDSAWRTIFLIVRFAGLVLLIPYLEEMFYRNFLLRWVASPDDFRRAAVGVADPVAVGFSTILFASTHPEWLAAVVFGLSMCALVRFSRDIRVCMVAHGATNLALGLYVIATHQWKYW